jgi:hypothetical protein
MVSEGNYGRGCARDTGIGVRGNGKVIQIMPGGT